MIVQCDKCHQQFDVPDDRLRPNGRKLKCPDCDNVFFQEAPAGSSPPVKVSQEPPDSEDPLDPEQETLPEGFDEEAQDLSTESESLEQEPLEEMLEDLQADHPEDDMSDLEEEDAWATSADELGEIDVDGDPELVALEAMETEAADEEETRPPARTDTVEEETLDDHSDDDMADTQRMIDDGAEPFLDEEDEDELTAAAKGEHLPLGDKDLLPEAGEPWPDEEPWPGEEDTELAPTVVAGQSGKIEPQLDIPGAAAALGVAAGAVAMAKASRPPEGPSAAGAAAQSATQEPVAPRRVARRASSGKRRATGPLWAAAAVLLVLAMGLISRTDWWEYAWFNWRSPYQLSTIESSWRKHNFGYLLLVQGEVTNNGSTASPPWVTVSLLDGKNHTLTTVQVVPGRVVDKKILEGSGEQAIQAMIRLQSQERTPSEATWSNKRLPFQAIFINPPGDSTRFQVDFSQTNQGSTQQKAQKTGAL
ncbi:MAG: zinc-ribbon domain-containing protein [Magnetococcus sp. MYC-9]